MYDIIDLNSKLVGELREIARELSVPKFESLKKQELVYKILDQQAMSGAKNSTKESGDEKPKRGRKPKVENVAEENPALFKEEIKVDSRFVSLEDKTEVPSDNTKPADTNLNVTSNEVPKPNPHPVNRPHAKPNFPQQKPFQKQNPYNKNTPPPPAAPAYNQPPAFIQAQMGKDNFQKPTDQQNETPKNTSNKPTGEINTPQQNPNQNQQKKEIGISFKIQITSSVTQIPLKSSLFKGLNVEEIKLDGYYKYTVCNTNSLKEIENLQKMIRSDFPDSFIVAFKNGKKILLSDAKKEIKN